MSLTLGEKLRQAREERGISISEVAEQTRISAHYLESIENDDYRPLPGGIFNKGFVKSYAKFIEIDEQEALQDRLAEKIAALCVRAGVSPPSPERVAQEVAVLVQRGDIEEELARLASHLVQFRGVLTAPAQVGQGKTLDFLSQELFREITTIGSKITSHAGSAAVIAAKATIERMREQVQNVE